MCDSKGQIGVSGLVPVMNLKRERKINTGSGKLVHSWNELRSVLKKYNLIYMGSLRF